MQAWWEKKYLFKKKHDLFQTFDMKFVCVCVYSVYACTVYIYLEVICHNMKTIISQILILIDPYSINKAVLFL